MNPSVYQKRGKIKVLNEPAEVGVFVTGTLPSHRRRKTETPDSATQPDAPGTRTGITLPEAQ